MCHDLDSHPPIQAIAGAAVDTRELVLKSSDGTEFAAYAALTPGTSAPAVVILPDIRGLHQFYKELADRFAENGTSAVAIDYFGRTAGVATRGDAFDWQTHVAQTKSLQVVQDVAAALAYLRKSNPQRAVFTVDFCFGGSNSWAQGMAAHQLNGVIGFYGGITRPMRDGSPSVLDRVPELKTPLLALMGGQDQGIPVADVDRFREALQAAHKQAEVVLYPEATHSFFDRRYVEFANASADAWRRVNAFIQAHA